MQNYSSHSFKYAGRKYAFLAEIFIKDENGKDIGTFLNNDDVILFQYDNAFNSLHLNAEMLVIDKYGVIDKYLDRQFVYVKISNIQHEENKDGSLTTENLSQTYRFDHEFFVTSIKITARDGNNITYQIQMVSSNWLNCISNVNFSNYTSKPQQIFDIIANILTTAKLEINEETFKKIKSPVKINYISQENDNVKTAIHYLLNKLYYYNDKEEQMKFIIYNETTHKYQLFDITDSEMSNGTSTVILSLFKSQMEIQSQSEPISLRSVTKVSKEQSFRSIFTKKICGYDLNNNNFIDCSIPSENLVLYKNKFISGIESKYGNKFQNFDTSMNYSCSGAFWNNDLNFYDETQVATKEDNALVILTDPEIIRKPGSYVVIDVDRDDLTIANSEDIQKLNDAKNKYKSFEGLWIVSKIRHIIAPQKPLYRQNLILTRNFIRK